MGLGRGDVLAVKSLVEIDGGVDFFHDSVGTRRKPPAPHFVAHDVTEISTAYDRTTRNRLRKKAPGHDSGRWRRRRDCRVCGGIRDWCPDRQCRRRCGKGCGMPAGGRISQETGTFGAGEVAAVNVAKGPLK